MRGSSLEYHHGQHYMFTASEHKVGTAEAFLLLCDDVPQGNKAQTGTHSIVLLHLEGFNFPFELF